MFFIAFLLLIITHLKINAQQPNTEINSLVFKHISSLIPYGPQQNDSVFNGDDECTPLTLANPFYYSSSYWNRVYICINGFITNKQTGLHSKLQLTSTNTPFIGPLVADFVTKSNSSVYYRQTSEESVINQLKLSICGQTTTNINISSALIVTWYNVSFFLNDTIKSTFQLVIASANNSKSYILFNYDSLSVPPSLKEFTFAGYALSYPSKLYKYINSNAVLEMLNSFEPVLGLVMSVNYAFNSAFIPVYSLLPYGQSNGDVLFESNSTCEASFSLSKYFYFELEHWDRVFVCKNGYISSSNALNSSLLLNGCSNIIGPLIGDLVSDCGSHIYYRETTNNSTLSQIKTIITGYYPNKFENVSLSSAFVVTW